MMDNYACFWISQVVNSKYKRNAQSLLKLDKERAGKIPAEFVTNGLPAHHDAFRKESWPKNKYCAPSKHTREIHFKNQVENNNIQERLNGEFRDREKTFRDLKKNDSPAISGLQMYYNYFRPHMGLDEDTSAL